jgi:hypothetical protein
MAITAAGASSLLLSVRFLFTSSSLPLFPVSDFFLRFFCFSFVLAAVLALFHVLLSSIA